MSYVRANTAPAFGMRSQSLSPMRSGFGYYFRSGFPLPTTSLSRPLRLNGAFYQGPYPVYGPQEWSHTRDMASRHLSGEWVPPSPPARAIANQGAVTYRIDPATGKYAFYSTDLLPRGVFQQSTFQHPAKPTLSALGVPMGSRGVQLVQIGGRNVVMNTTPGIRRGPTSQEPMVRLKAAFSGALGNFAGCGCGCGCGGCKGLGTDACGPQPDGSIVPCGPDVGGATEQSSTAPAPGTTIETIIPAPSNSGSGSGPGSVTSFLQQLFGSTATPPPGTIATVVVPPAAPTSLSSFFSGSSFIAGVKVPNVLLVGGLVLALASHGRKGR